MRLFLLLCSAGTILHGHGTKFMSEISVGDAIIIGECQPHALCVSLSLNPVPLHIDPLPVHPSTLQEETKIVRLVVSDVGAGVSSAFSSDLISTCEFRCARRASLAAK